MRDYNFRKKAKIKEIDRRKELYYNRGYKPTMPNRKTNDNGLIYYTEGIQSFRKNGLKRQGNVSVRQFKLRDINSGSNYKKIYNLNWIWY